jgi:hypothetical protein
MSQINTNGINVNYPVPGVNNNSQGFRDNFAAIQTNLNTAGTEITDLQNNVVVKSALANTTINNNMANTLISNALTRSFRASTYNLGNNISNTIVINASLGDVQYGTISGNTTIQFAGWAPAGTQSNLQLELNVSNANAVISFPSQVSMTGSYGVETLENFANVGNVATVSIPYGVSQLEYRLSTIDCGNTITIEPFNRPRIDTQIQQRTPAPTGFQGDVAGTVAVDANYIYVATGTFNSGGANTVTKAVSATYSGNLINCVSTTSLVVNAPIIFSGNTWGNIVAGTPYYIKSIPDGSNITISATGFDGAAGATFAVDAGAGTLVANSYNGSTIWKRIDLAGPYGNDIVTGNLAVTYAANIGTTLSVIGNANVGNLGTIGSITSGNITSSGTLSVSGNTTLSSRLNIATANMKMTGGTNGFFLQTDGTGNLSWTNGTVEAPATGAGGADTQIQFNDAGAPNGAAGFTFNKSTQLTSLPATLTVVGNITGANIITTGITSATGNGTFGNITTAGLLTVTGNANVGNIGSTSGVFTGTLSSTGNANVGNIGTAGLITATGNIGGGNINSAGAVLSSGTSGVGYTTGAGSTVSQASSRTTGVTINAVTGSITLVSAAGSPTYNTFTVTNNKVAETDVIIINQKSGTDKYEVFITNVSAGSFAVTFADMNGTTVEQPILNFAIIKGATA